MVAGSRDVVATRISLLMLALLTTCSPAESQQDAGSPTPGLRGGQQDSAGALMGSVVKMEEALDVELKTDKVATDGQPEHHTPAPSLDQSPRAPSRVSRRLPLNLIFTLDPRPVDQGGKIFEATWIQQEVLSQIKRPVRVQYFDVRKGWEDHPWKNDSLIVYMDKSSEYNAAMSYLLQKLHSQGVKNIGAYHMGDEGKGKGGTDWYKDADYVMRNYWFKEYENIAQWVPLGTRVGLTSQTQLLFLPSSRRKFLCNFVGSLRADRGIMLENLHYKREECNLQVNTKYADPEGKHPFLLHQVLLDSKFTLAPFGNNEESNRFYEALESGSIPIVRRSEKGDGGDFITDGLGGNAPMPRVGHWNELDDVLKKYNEDPEALDKLQEDVLAWWSERRHAALSRLGSFVEKSFERFHGGDA